MATKKTTPETEVETERVAVVIYEDGSKAEVRLTKPALILALEREWGVSSPSGAHQFEQILWMAWHALKRPTEFEDWIDTVDDVEWVDREKAPKA